MLPEGIRPAADHHPVIFRLLAQDPRPHYQNDPDKVYGMSFAGYEIKFRVDTPTLTVISAEK